ncbi:MAG: molybdate ABC transporter substrate-binding protein [Proteobacteria bacterium]|nr:molybdate ABC transporter substrate-binding protein [Pseudomonadota bacterium]
MSSASPLVATASGMQFAIREIALKFYEDTGIKVRITLGSSGNLYRQIKNNAPFDLFISADNSLTKKLESEKLTLNDRVVIAKGRLVVFAPTGSPLIPDEHLGGLKIALSEGQITRFAIASPKHAPYGQRAKEALQSAKLWEAVKDKLVIGENVAQATQFAVSGTAQGGIIARSLVVVDKISNRGQYALLPESWHQPILHSMALLKNADEVTLKFFQYIRSKKGQDILSLHGFNPSY